MGGTLLRVFGIYAVAGNQKQDQARYFNAFLDSRSLYNMHDSKNEAALVYHAHISRASCIISHFFGENF